jgi:hypothetical protein
MATFTEAEKDAHAHRVYGYLAFRVPFRALRYHLETCFPCLCDGLPSGSSAGVRVSWGALPLFLVGCTLLSFVLWLLSLVPSGSPYPGFDTSLAFMIRWLGVFCPCFVLYFMRRWWLCVDCSSSGDVVIGSGAGCATPGVPCDFINSASSVGSLSVPTDEHLTVSVPDLTELHVSPSLTEPDGLAPVPLEDAETHAGSCGEPGVGSRGSVYHLSASAASWFYPSAILSWWLIICCALLLTAVWLFVLGALLGPSAGVVTPCAPLFLVSSPDQLVLTPRSDKAVEPTVVLLWRYRRFYLMMCAVHRLLHRVRLGKFVSRGPYLSSFFDSTKGFPGMYRVVVLSCLP